MYVTYEGDDGIVFDELGEFFDFLFEIELPDVKDVIVDWTVSTRMSIALDCCVIEHFLS